MPIYEFRCPGCGQRTSLLLRQFSPPSPPPCPGCGGTLSRLFSPFAYHRSAKDIQEGSGDPDRPRPEYYQDPRNIGRWVEKRFEQMGEEVPSGVKEMIKAAREGELPGAAKDLQPNLSQV